MDLKRLRKKIDSIDKHLLQLLNMRARTILDIAKIKREKNLPVYQPQREKEIIERLCSLNKGPLKNTHLKNIFTEIFSSCTSLQQPLKIAYLGPQGTFTHQAAIKKFGKSADYINCPGIKEVFGMVSSQKVLMGVVPVENSIEGVVTHTLDMFIDSDLRICAEIHLRISLNLLSKEKDIKRIEKIYSHPQVFDQAENWLKTNLPGRTFLSCASTSLAAQLCSKERKSACIGSEILAEIYNLHILRRDIQDYLHNITRFLVISNFGVAPTGKDKTSILLSVKDKPGALYRILRPFSQQGINLTKIESRPSRRKAWEYFFFIDFEGHVEDKKIQKALSVIEKNTLFLKILGSYPKDETQT